MAFSRTSLFLAFALLAVLVGLSSAGSSQAKCHKIKDCSGCLALSYCQYSPFDEQTPCSKKSDDEKMSPFIASEGEAQSNLADDTCAAVEEFASAVTKKAGLVAIHSAALRVRRNSYAFKGQFLIFAKEVAIQLKKFAEAEKNSEAAIAEFAKHQSPKEMTAVASALDKLAAVCTHDLSMLEDSGRYGENFVEKVKDINSVLTDWHRKCQSGMIGVADNGYPALHGAVSKMAEKLGVDIAVLQNDIKKLVAEGERQCSRADDCADFMLRTYGEDGGEYDVYSRKLDNVKYTLKQVTCFHMDASVCYFRAPGRIDGRGLSQSFMSAVQGLSQIRSYVGRIDAAPLLSQWDKFDDGRCMPAEDYMARLEAARGEKCGLVAARADEKLAQMESMDEDNYDCVRGLAEVIDATSALQDKVKRLRGRLVHDEYANTKGDERAKAVTGKSLEQMAAFLLRSKQKQETRASRYAELKEFLETHNPVQSCMRDMKSAMDEMNRCGKDMVGDDTDVTLLGSTVPIADLVRAVPTLADYDFSKISRAEGFKKCSQYFDRYRSMLQAIQNSQNRELIRAAKPVFDMYNRLYEEGMEAAKESRRALRKAESSVRDALRSQAPSMYKNAFSAFKAAKITENRAREIAGKCMMVAMAAEVQCGGSLDDLPMLDGKSAAAYARQHLRLNGFKYQRDELPDVDCAFTMHERHGGGNLVTLFYAGKSFEELADIMGVEVPRME